MTDFNLEGVVTEFYNNSLEWSETESKDEQLPFDPSNEPLYEDEAWYVEQAEEFATNQDALVESLPNITRISEIAFVELSARLYLIATGAERALGTIMWKRLRETLGFDQAKESSVRNTQVWKWAMQISKTDDRLFHRLQKWIDDAIARDLDPRVEQLSVTAGDEILGGIDSADENVVRETIQQRVDAVESLDPLGEQSTTTVREVKQLEKNGNYQPKMFLARNSDLNTPIYAEYAIYANIRVGSTALENGEFVDEYEPQPIAYLTLAEPSSEELRDQFTNYWRMVKQRQGKYVGDFNPNPDQDSD